MNFRSLILIGSMMASSAPAHAANCLGFLGRIVKRPVPARERSPAIATGVHVGPLVDAHWNKISDYWISELRTPWGETVILYTDAYLTISARPVGGDLHFNGEILERLRRDAGPTEFRDHVAVSPGENGKVKADHDWYTIYLGRGRDDADEYARRAKAMLHVFFGALPHELRQVPRTEGIPIDIIPLSVRDDRWRLVGRNWVQRFQTPWGQALVTIGERRLTFKIEPKAGDLIFGERDLRALHARVPAVRYELEKVYNPGLDTLWFNTRGDFELTFDQDGDYDVTVVEWLLNAVLTDLPKKARAEMLTGRRPPKLFDPASRASTEPIGR